MILCRSKFFFLLCFAKIREFSDVNTPNGLASDIQTGRKHAANHFWMFYSLTENVSISSTKVNINKMEKNNWNWQFLVCVTVETVYESRINFFLSLQTCSSKCLPTIVKIIHKIWKKKREKFQRKNCIALNKIPDHSAQWIYHTPIQNDTNLPKCICSTSD